MPSSNATRLPKVFDIRTDRVADFHQSIEDGIFAPKKCLPSLLLWDAPGLVLFDNFAATAAYYPAKKELELIQQHADDIVSSVQPGAMIIELGSG